MSDALKPENISKTHVWMLQRQIDEAVKKAQAFVSRDMLRKIAQAEVAQWISNQADEANPERVLSTAREVMALIDTDQRL